MQNLNLTKTKCTDWEVYSFKFNAAVTLVLEYKVIESGIKGQNWRGIVAITQSLTLSDLL